MKKIITLKLINNENKNSRILSSKVCITDSTVCSNGATDICLSTDLAGCSGTMTIDYCKYIDNAACAGSYDYCYYDFLACYYGLYDLCATDT